MTHQIGGLVLVVAALLGVRSPAAATLFGTLPAGGDTTLVTIDLATGAATARGAVGFPDVRALAGRPSDTVLYGAMGTGAGANAGRVLTISPLLGSAGTALGSAPGHPIGDLAWTPDGAVLYATCNRFSGPPMLPDGLCRVQPLTGALTPVNDFNPIGGGVVSNFTGLAFSPSGILYAATSTTNNPPGDPRLYTIDTTNGGGTAVGAIRDGGGVQLAASIVGLEFLGTTLYASTDAGQILTINPATGVYRLVGATGIGAVYGLGATDVVYPSPSPTSTPTPTPVGPTPTPSQGPCTSNVPLNPCIPGNGSTRTDCVLEWLAVPVPLLKNGTPVPDLENSMQRNRLFCYDGDTRCDVDSVTNNSCTFQVQLCANNTDPRLPCTPLDLTAFEVKSPNPKRLRDAADTANLASILAHGTFGVTVTNPPITPGVSNNQPNTCSSRIDLMVPLEVSSAGRVRKAKRTIKIRGATTAGQKDSDSIALECRPTTCGNSVIERDHETCDDGNRTNGDGCNQACQIETAPTATPSLTPTSPLPPTSTPTAVATPTATRTPSNPPTTSPTTGPSSTATLTPTPTVTDTPTPGPAETATETPTLTATPTETATISATDTPQPTRTPTPTPPCGDGFLGTGESCCASCPPVPTPPAPGCDPCGTASVCGADCTVNACTPPTPGTFKTFTVDLAYPPGPVPGSVTLLLGYKSVKVSLPGSGSAPALRFTTWPSNTSRGVNDLNYAVRVVASQSLGFSIGRLFVVNFDGCSGQAAPTASELGCTVEGCANATGDVDGCTCSVR